MNDIIVLSTGVIEWNTKQYRCALGSGGVIKDKKEGDGGTPEGCFPIRMVMYRTDKIEKPITVFPLIALDENDGWCDDVNDGQYNKKVSLPYLASHEKLWREDDLYDVIVVLGYNDAPVEKGKGSAVFMHVARPSFTSTAGCIALVLSDLLEILKGASVESKVCIKSVAE